MQRESTMVNNEETSKTERMKRKTVKKIQWKQILGEKLKEIEGKRAN